MKDLLTFINSNKNWEEELSKPPYNITIKHDKDYILLKYNQLNSAMENKLVQQCRGCIIKKVGHKYKYVCRPFDKFFNHNEPNAPTNFDWEHCYFMPKFDGSLIKVWYDCGEWHISTNGSINAFTAEVNDYDISYGDLFIQCLGTSVENFFKKYNKHYTYLFELITLENLHVVQYSDNFIVALVKRHTRTGKIKNFYCEERKSVQSNLKIKYTKKELEQKLINQKNFEGYVGYDNKGNIVKFKTIDYLEKAHLYKAGNQLTYKNLLTFILAEQEDDLLSIYPQYRNKIEEIKEDLGFLKFQIEETEKLYACFEDKETLSRYVKDLDPFFSSYLYAKRDDESYFPLMHIKNTNTKKLIKVLNNLY